VVLEQVADAGADLQEADGVRGFGVRRQDQHPEVRIGAAQCGCGGEAFIGEGGRHADVQDDRVGHATRDECLELGDVGGLTDDVDADIGEQQGQAATEQGGVVAIGAVSQRATATATATVVVTVSGEIGGVPDLTPVQVWVAIQAHRAVLAVPTAALRALPGLRYELIVGTRHVPVKVGLFDEADGVVEVSGEGLAAGQRVAVPPGTV
jgi:hypothetical protein